MRLEKLILKKFLTFEFLEHDFENRPLLIQGLNLTDENQKTNGTGKSGMQTGIEFCITASNSRDVRDAELVTYGESEANAQLFASCDHRKERIHIDWKIKVKGSNQLTLKVQKYGEQGWTKVSFSNVNDGKKWIVDWFGISKEDLFNYFIINKTRFKSFFKSSNSSKVDLINRFSDASIIEGLEDIDTSELEKAYDDVGKEINSIEGKIELLESQLEFESSKDYENEYKERIDEINEVLDEVRDEIDESLEGIEERKKAKKRTKKEIKSELLHKDELLEEIKKDEKCVETFMESVIVPIEAEIEKATKVLEDFKTTDWSEARMSFEEDIDLEEEALEEVEDEIEANEKRLSEINKVLENIDVKLSGSITCPSCGHVFVLDDDIESLKEKKSKGQLLKVDVVEIAKSLQDKVSERKKMIQSIEKQLSKINQKEMAENNELLDLKDDKMDILSRLKKSERELDSLKRVIKDKKSEVQDIKRDVKSLRQDIENHDKHIERIEREIESLEKEIQKLKKEKKELKVGNADVKIKELTESLKEWKEARKSKQEEYDKRGDAIYKRNQWKLYFKQFRMHLANNSLEVIEYHCNRYLTDMGSDLRVKMEGYKVLANGKIKEEITAKVVRDIERNFSSFSGGEQGRLLFASILANRHMINSTHPYGGLDFLSIDEVFEGVDSVGLKHLIKSAKTLEVPVMIITHVTDEAVGSDRLLVIKENGVSTIKRS